MCDEAHGFRGVAGKDPPSWIAAQELGHGVFEGRPIDTGREGGGHPPLVLEGRVHDEPGRGPQGAVVQIDAIG